MIPITFVNEATGFDVVFEVSLREHQPIDERRVIAIADAGDFIEPDLIYKGSSTVTQFTTNALPASRIGEFDLFRLNTRHREFTVDATTVPLVGVVYSAFRMGNTVAVSIHGGRFFYFAIDARIVRIET